MVRTLLFVLAFAFASNSWGNEPIVLSKDDLGLPVLQGKAPGLEQSGLRVLLLDVWASWCEPCKESLPLYQKSQAAWARKGIFIHTVNADEESKDAKDYLSKHRIKLPVVWDQNRTLIKKLRVDAIPTLVAVDKTGRVLGLKRGFNKKSSADLERTITEWLRLSEQ